MGSFTIEIQIPSGNSIDVTPSNAMPIIRGLLDGTDYVPELVTSLLIKAESSEGRKVEILLSPVEGFHAIVDVSE